MININYLLLFYIVEIVGFLLVLVLLFVCGFFSKQKTKSRPKTTLDFLLEQTKTSNNDKEVLDSVMREFHSQFYTIAKSSNLFDKWLDLLQAITILDYMSVEQAANFRDDLTKKNPSIKKEIEQAIGVSLKYRESQGKNQAKKR